MKTRLVLPALFVFAAVLLASSSNSTIALTVPVAQDTLRAALTMATAVRFQKRNTR
jgi:hypothetical protein